MPKRKTNYLCPKCYAPLESVNIYTTLKTVGYLEENQIAAEYVITDPNVIGTVTEKILCPNCGSDISSYLGQRAHMNYE